MRMSNVMTRGLIMHKLLNTIQQSIKVEKGQWNDFSKFKYRNCEDILKAVKPLLVDANLVLTDEIINLGERYYIKATAKLIDGNGSSIESYGWAREAENKKGMDECQLSGSTSSYARKYALCGLFAIDDGIDSDSMDNSKSAKVPEKETKWYNLDKAKTDQMLAKLKSGEQTNQGIIDSLKNAGFAISKKTKEDIMGLK